VFGRPSHGRKKKDDRLFVFFPQHMFDACIVGAYVLTSLNVSRVDAIPLDKQYSKRLISITVVNLSNTRQFTHKVKKVTHELTHEVKPTSTHKITQEWASINYPMN